MDNFFEFRSDIRVSTAKNQDGVRFFTIKWFWAHRLQTVDLTRVSLLYVLFLRSIGISYCQGWKNPAGFLKNPARSGFSWVFRQNVARGMGFFAKNPGFLGFLKKFCLKKKKKIKLIE